MVKTLQQLMTKEVVKLERTKPVQEAVQVMARKSISCVVITDKGKPVGVTTERDMVKKVLHKGLNPVTTKLEKIMSAPLITVGPDVDIFTAESLMKEHQIRRLVIEDNGKLAGLITENDIGGLITDASLRSIFHRMSLKKDLEIARLRSMMKNTKTPER